MDLNTKKQKSFTFSISELKRRIDCQCGIYITGMSIYVSGGNEISGGFDNSCPLDDHKEIIVSSDLSDVELYNRKKMNGSRIMHTVIKKDENSYFALGGRRKTNTSEYYDIRKDKWTRCPNFGVLDSVDFAFNVDRFVYVGESNRRKGTHLEYIDACDTEAGWKVARIQTNNNINGVIYSPMQTSPSIIRFGGQATMSIDNLTNSFLLQILSKGNDSDYYIGALECCRIPPIVWKGYIAYLEKDCVMFFSIKDSSKKVIKLDAEIENQIKSVIKEEKNPFYWDLSHSNWT